MESNILSTITESLTYILTTFTHFWTYETIAKLDGEGFKQNDMRGSNFVRLDNGHIAMINFEEVDKTSSSWENIIAHVSAKMNSVAVAVVGRIGFFITNTEYTTTMSER